MKMKTANLTNMMTKQIANLLSGDMHSHDQWNRCRKSSRHCYQNGNHEMAMDTLAADRPGETIPNCEMNAKPYREFKKML